MHNICVTDLKRIKITRSVHHCLMVMTAFFIHWSSPLCQTSAALRTEIGKIISHDTELSKYQIPGFIIGILDGDTTHVLAFGTREIGTHEVLSSHDIFELGSLTKVMTADIILQLNEKGFLDVYAPLNLYLPVAYQNPSVQASLMDVLTHRSGLPKIPETLGGTQIDMNSPYAGFTHKDLLSWYSHVRPHISGELRYSHAGYALLELVIEQVTGDSFERAFDKYITNTYAIPGTRVDDMLHVCPGYDLTGRGAHPWEFNSFRGSEGARSNLLDLLKYMRVLINTEETMLMWTTYHRTGDKKLFTAPGWYRFLPKKDFPVYVHTGRTSGHSSMFAFSRNTKTGVIVLSNSSAGTDDLGLLILRMINSQWRRKT